MLLLKIINSKTLNTTLFMFLFLHYLASPSNGQPPFTAYECIDDYGNYTNKSPFKTNLDTLLSNIKSNTTINYGFYKLSVGQSLDIVHGIALCRADVSSSKCHSCIGYASSRITQDCPNIRAAVGWYDECMIRYSNLNIFNGVSFVPGYNMTNTRSKMLDKKTFNQTVEPLLRKLVYKAASGDSRRKFSTGEVDVSKGFKMYALLQCTPNLEEFDCFDCLTIVINYTLAPCCYGYQGARAAAPSCNIRYENYQFYGSASALPPLPLQSPPPPISPVSPLFVAQPRGFESRVCQDTFGNYTSNSIFKRNLDQLLSSIESNSQIDYGFYNISVGQGLDTVHGIGLCRPDRSVADCHRCLNSGAQEIVQNCPNQKDAIGWYDECMIRYTDRYIFGKMELGPWYYLNDTLLNIDKGRLNQTTSTLLTRLQKEAASGDSRYKFAAGEADVTADTTIYALVQCTPDLEEYDCYECLDNAISFALEYFYGGKGRVFFTSCNIQYETSAFYNVQELPNTSSRPPASPFLPPSFHRSINGRISTKSRIVSIVVGTFLALLVLATLALGYCFLRRGRKSNFAWSKDENAERTPELQMDFATIKVATGNFSNANELGRGGFGTVYKGRLPNGQEIAVKRLSKSSRQGNAQFKNEILALAKLEHRNLVRLMGFCFGDEEKLLIFELMANGSLEKYIFDPVRRASMPWSTRYKIINGIAKGLLYLHEDSQLRIIHRDIKAGNVLLDSEFNPKIADFGIARLFNIDQTSSTTSKILGTYGYMAPEYVRHGYASVKSDVFSFGVLVLEIVSGQRIGSFENEDGSENLVNYAWKNWLKSTPWKFVDPTLISEGCSAGILECLHIGLLCVQHDPTLRPTMSSVALMLSNSSQSLPVPSTPGFFSTNVIQLDVPSPKHALHKDGNNSLATMSVSCEMISITELDPR